MYYLDFQSFHLAKPSFKDDSCDLNHFLLQETTGCPFQQADG